MTALVLFVIFFNKSLGHMFNVSSISVQTGIHFDSTIASTVATNVNDCVIISKSSPFTDWFDLTKKVAFTLEMFQRRIVPCELEPDVTTSQTLRLECATEERIELHKLVVSIVDVEVDGADIIGRMTELNRDCRSAHEPLLKCGDLGLRKGKILTFQGRTFRASLDGNEGGIDAKEF